MREDAPAPDWPPGPDAPVLSPGDVHLWLFTTRATENERECLRSLLADDELARAGRFRLDHLARRYVVGHGRLRRLLAAYIESEPTDIRFVTGPHGKPAMAPEQNPQGVAFSFAHSEETCLAGIASGRSIGVDVEAYRDRLDMDLIVRRQFAPAEASKFDRVRGAGQRQDAFYACWTRKEAYIKARGEGLAAGLDSFEVSFLPGEANRIVASSRGSEECERWEVIPLDLGPRLAGACVVERPVESVSYWTFDACRPSRGG